jgi:hypothetical protein
MLPADGIDTQLGEQRIGLLLEVHGGIGQDDKHHRHCREHCPALARIADHAAEGEAQRGRDQEDRQHLDEVAQRRRVFIGMRRVGVEETATVGAQHLDRFLRSDRAHGQRLGLGFGRFGDDGALSSFKRLTSGIELGRVVAGHFQRRHFLVGVEILDDALAGQEDRVNDEIGSNT